MKAFVAFLVSTLISVMAFAQSSLPGQDMSWKIVANEKVCMVTERHFGFSQIPVKVEGKTYYGCCDNCKQTLASGAKARTAMDPLTKNPVDKATAVIAANNTGNVLYFESKKNFDKYLKNLKALKR
ncbi:MAG: TRASH domain-containing protein [Bdellovibrio sp.]